MTYSLVIIVLGLLVGDASVRLPQIISSDRGWAMVLKLPKISEETKLVILLAVAIFGVEFSIMVFIHSISYKSPILRIVLDASLLVLVVSPILLIPKQKVEEAKGRLRRLNSILRAIRNVNRLINHNSDIERVLNEACKTLREVRDYFYVTIAICEDRVVKVAEDGSGSFFRAEEEIPVCATKAIKQKKPVILDDTKKHCGKCKYHQKSVDYSAAIIPFRSLGKTLLLNVFASINHFDDEEIELLKTVADDIGFAISKYTTDDELVKSQQRLSGIVESITDHLILIDEQFNIVWANKVAKKFFEEDITGKKCYSVYSRRIEVCEECIGKLCFEDGGIHEFEVDVFVNNGDSRTFLCKAGVAEFYAERKPRLVMLLKRDITQRKKSRLKLIESENRYRTTFESTGTAMGILEGDTTISLANSELIKLLDSPKEEIEGKMSLTQFVHPDDLEGMVEYHYSRMRGDNTTDKYEFRLMNRNGDVRNVLCQINTIPGTDSSVASLVDITTLKRLNKLLTALSEINELVARERCPKIVLKTVCDKLTSVYDAVFTSLREDSRINPVESRGIDLSVIQSAVRRCPSIMRALEGETSKMKMDGELCRHCTSIPHNYVLSIPLIHEKNFGVITIHSKTDFSEDEIKLLEKLSKNIAFALSAYRVEEDRKRAFDQLATNLTQFEKSADRLRNPLAVIIGTLELKEELGTQRVLEMVDENIRRIKKELDEMRVEEIKTYDLIKKNL